MSRMQIIHGKGLATNHPLPQNIVLRRTLANDAHRIAEFNRVYAGQIQLLRILSRQERLQ